MKSSVSVLSIILWLLSFTVVNAHTNDFYDDAETLKLKVPDIEVMGEMVNQGSINLELLPFRSVEVKETLLQDGKDKYLGHISRTCICYMILLIR